MRFKRFEFRAQRWPWQGKATSMGRFGGGWKLSLCLRAGWTRHPFSLVIMVDLLIGSLLFMILPPPKKESVLVVTKTHEEFLAFCRRNQLTAGREALFVRDVEMLLGFRDRQILFVGRWQERSDWREIRNMARARDLRSKFHGDKS